MLSVPPLHSQGLSQEALNAASLVGRPVHVYYFAGGGAPPPDGASVAVVAPSEVLAPAGVDVRAEPLRLLHLVHERHFDLLVPQHVVVERQEGREVEREQEEMEPLRI